MRQRVLVPLPDNGFDVTEVAVPWRLLTDAGCDVVFATESGATPPARTRCCWTGSSSANSAPRTSQAVTAETPPAIRVSSTDLLPRYRSRRLRWVLLPGRSRERMRQYLSSAQLQLTVAAFWALDRPVGAICHGVLVLARTQDPATGRSVIADRQTTCLPKYMERTAFL